MLHGPCCLLKDKDHEIMTIPIASSQPGRIVSSEHHSYQRECPFCQGVADRVHRHFFDRVISLIHLKYRYRCRSGVCRWEGTLPAFADNSKATVNDHSSHKPTQTSRIR